MVTLYNVISQDGYISRLDGSEDFIPDEAWIDFLNICKQNDVEIMGRKTYEAIQKYPEQMVKEFENLKIKKVVVTKNSEFIAKPLYTVVHSLKDALALGTNILISSGPTLNTSALREGLIDKIVLNILPVKIGSGIKIFENEPDLILISEKDLKNGQKWRIYKIAK